MKTTNLRSELRHLNVAKEQIPESACAETLEKMIVNRKNEIMETLPPGTFVTIEPHDTLALIKSYSMSSNAPDTVVIEVNGKQRNPGIGTLAFAQKAEDPDNPMLLEKAKFWSARHTWFLEIRQRAESVLASSEQVEFNPNYLSAFAKQLLNTVWPIRRNSPKEITDDEIKKSAREWISNHKW